MAKVKGMKLTRRQKQTLADTYAKGVAAHGRENWLNGFKPYHAALRKLKLPERGPLRSPENYERALAVVNCMHWVKVREDAKKLKRKQGGRLGRR